MHRIGLMLFFTACATIDDGALVHRSPVECIEVTVSTGRRAAARYWLGGEELSSSRLRNVLREDPHSHRQAVVADAASALSWIAVIGGLVLAIPVGGTFLGRHDDNIGWSAMGTGLALTVTGFALRVPAADSLQRAIVAYNGPNSNGNCP